MAIESRNPANEELRQAYEPLSDQKIDAALAKSVSAHQSLKRMSFADRSELMLRAAAALDENQARYAALLTGEMGKPIAEAEGEVAKCASVCRYYAEHAAAHLADRHIQTEAQRSFVRYLPIGPVLAVMPWNFPFWQVFRFAAPALMAGNTGLLKHASNVPQSALAIEEVFTLAGFPEGSFLTLLIGASQVAGVLKDTRVRAATLTGSEPAGAQVAATAGEHIKKTVLELGGSDPFLVMPSANLDDAVDMAVKARLINNGQSCIAGKRFIVHQAVYGKFRDGLVARYEALNVGDPLDRSTNIGPLALASIRDEVADQVQNSIAAGAKATIGGTALDRRGYFLQPGILESIPPAAPAYAEELFGPVALLHKVDSLDAGITLANASRFGLGSAIFTQDDNEIEQAINELDAGATFVNSMVASDPRLPFGGVKASGYGRELAAEGIREFVNVKTISIR